MISYKRSPKSDMYPTKPIKKTKHSVLLPVEHLKRERGLQDNLAASSVAIKCHLRSNEARRNAPSGARIELRSHTN